MTTVYVLMALAAAYVLYAVHDARRDEAIHQMNDFYAVENKRRFADSEEAAMGRL